MNADASETGAGIDLAAICASVAGQATADEQIEAYAVRRSDVEVRAFDGGIESFSSADTAGIGVRVINDHRQGFAYSGVLDADSAGEVLADARDNAAYGTQDDDLGLISPEDFDFARLDLDLCSPLHAGPDADAKVEVALDAERRMHASDQRVRSGHVDYADATAEVAIVNSLGVADRAERTVATIAAYAIVEDGGETRTGFGYDLGRALDELDTGTFLDEAVGRAVRLLGAEQPGSQRIPVVLDPFVAAAFLGVIAGTLNGESVLKGRSIFADRVGESIAAPCLTLVDDATDTDAFGAAAFDAEGVPTSRCVLVESGRLDGFLQNTYTGRRSRTTTTGSAMRASYKSAPGVGARVFGASGGDTTLAEMLRRADGGIYVQSVQGLHSGVNAVSGDFSVGAEGLWIRDGELAVQSNGSVLALAILS